MNKNNAQVMLFVNQFFVRLPVIIKRMMSIATDFDKQAKSWQEKIGTVFFSTQKKKWFVLKFNLMRLKELHRNLFVTGPDFQVGLGFNEGIKFLIARQADSSVRPKAA